VLSVNAWDEDPDVLKQFAENHKLKQKILLFGEKTGDAYGIIGVPTVLWINREGTVVDAEIDFKGRESLDRKTQSLLSSSR